MTGAERNVTRRVLNVTRAVVWSSVGGLLCFWAIGLAGAEETPAAGRQIYQQQCAGCHGDQGQGSEEAGTGPFTGDHALADLVRIIDETMPEDDPEACQGEAAQAVAQYVLDAFVTPQAEALQPAPRIELSRLTVRQYREAVADLMATFLGTPQLSDQRGLKAGYYNARGFNRDKRVIERTDPRVVFDFGEKSPQEGAIGDEEFAIQWQGAVIADETGDYEFCVTTENGTRLWVNDMQNPLIDAWVASGGLQQHRATMHLLGGRVYPLRLDFFKFKIQSASIKLSWTPPRRAEEVIPQRSLSPDWAPRTYVVNTAFPPDDRSMGYERGTSVSKAWEQAVSNAAIEAAGWVAENLDALAKCKPDAEDRSQKIQQMCHRLAERAFRRPLSDEVRQFYVDQFFTGQQPVELAAKRSVLLVLQSPRFLYVAFDNARPDQYDIASRLAFALWDSLPDTALLAAAQAGQLQTPQQIAEHARRMLEDPRTRAKLRSFLHAWLNIEYVDKLAKDGEQYPGFDATVVSDLRVSLDLFLDDVIWNGSGDFRELLLSDAWFVNPKLASFYAVEAEMGEQYQKVSGSPDQNAGLLTHPYLMARYAYHRSSSPIHRGVFVVRGLLGRFLKPPPIAVAPLDEGFDPTLTTRERVARQTKEPMCLTCHGMINELGFAFENYDAVGRFRTEEKANPIDASGSYKDLEGTQVTFRGARELAAYLAQSPETHRCFAQQLFHYVAKQPVAAYGAETMNQLQKSFAESDFNVRELLVAIAATSALGVNEE